MIDQFPVHGPRPEPEPVEAALDRITERLAVRYDGAIDREVVQAAVDETFRRLDTQAKVKQHLTALVVHDAADRLAGIHREASSGD